MAEGGMEALRTARARVEATQLGAARPAAQPEEQQAIQMFTQLFGQMIVNTGAAPAAVTAAAGFVGVLLPQRTGMPEVGIATDLLSIVLLWHRLHRVAQEMNTQNGLLDAFLNDCVNPADPDGPLIPGRLKQYSIDYIQPLVGYLAAIRSNIAPEDLPSPPGLPQTAWKIHVEHACDRFCVLCNDVKEIGQKVKESQTMGLAILGVGIASVVAGLIGANRAETSYGRGFAAAAAAGGGVAVVGSCWVLYKASEVEQDLLRVLEPLQRFREVLLDPLLDPIVWLERQRRQRQQRQLQLERELQPPQGRLLALNM